MPAWALALASCVHVALAVVRQHRSARGLRRVLLVAIGYAAAASPWVWPLPSTIAIGLIAHAGWLLATDSIAHAAQPAPRAGDENPSSGKAGPASARAAPARTSVSRGFVPLTVLAVLDETPDIRTFRLARPEGFAFTAGQFLPVRLKIDGVDHVRCYSISSAPHTSGYLEISIKRQGLVSSALHATLRAGAALHARPPAGAFTYPANDDRPLVLLAAGVGITPLASMLRHALHAEPQRPVVLVQSAHCAEGLAFADEMRLLSRRHANFRWVPAVSRGDAGGEFYPGRIDRALLDVAVPDLVHSVVCLCGPGAMIEDTREVLAASGVPRAQVRFELFEAAIASAGAAAEAEPPPDDSTPIITFSRTGTAIPAPAGQTVLDVAERSGIAIPSLCRAGVCGTCRTRVTTGDVHCRSTALDPDDAADGYVLACVAHARTDCAVDA